MSVCIMRHSILTGIMGFNISQITRLTNFITFIFERLLRSKPVVSYIPIEVKVSRICFFLFVFLFNDTKKKVCFSIYFNNIVFIYQNKDLDI